MNRVVLDTNVIVSALLARRGNEASILLLALRGDIAIYVSQPVMGEYKEVLRQPRLKLQPRQVEEALAAIGKVAHLVEPTKKLSISTHAADNRFLECAEAAEADYLVTGNARHFPQSHKTTKIVTGRRFLDILARPEGK
jgi:putative PIN family toxin of toxin-antitoxin system